MGLRDDPEAMRKYKREWVARRRAEFFMDKACVLCGSTERLELDHIDPQEKAHHAIWTWAEPRRLAEIAKCQVLCHDCHVAKSVVQQPITNGWLAYRHGTGSMYKKRKCRCGLCKLWNRNQVRMQRAKSLPTERKTLGSSSF